MASREGTTIRELLAIPDAAIQRLRVSRAAGAYEWVSGKHGQNRVTMTPELARQFLTELNTMAIQRDIRPLTLGSLAGAALTATLRPGTVIALYRFSDGTLQVVNGQHTLLAIELAGVTVDLAVHTYVRRGRRGDRAALCELYMSFDRITTGRRTMYDYARVVGLDKTFPTKTAVNKWLAASKPITGGLTDTGLRTWRNEPEYVLHVAEQLIEPTRRYFELVSGTSRIGRDMLTSQRIMPVMLVVLKYAPRLATQFIQGVLDDSLRASDPRARLRDLVLEYNEGGASVLSTWRHFASATAIAWRAFVTRGSSVDFSQLNAPIELARTPFRRGYMPPHPYHSTGTLNAIKQIVKSRGVPDRRADSTRERAAARRRSKLGS